MRIRTVRKDSLEGLNVIVKVASSAPKWNMVSRQHASGHQRSSVWSDGSPPTRGCVDIYRRLAMTETLYSLFRMRTTMTKPVFEFHDTISHMHSWCLLYEGMVFLLAWVTLNWAPVQDNWGKYHSRPKRYFRLIAPPAHHTQRWHTKAAKIRVFNEKFEIFHCACKLTMVFFLGHTLPIDNAFSS